MKIIADENLYQPIIDSFIVKLVKICIIYYMKHSIEKKWRFNANNDRKSIS